MPQIYLMVAPRIREAMNQATLQILNEKLSGVIVEEWKVPEDDIACSAAALLYTHGEADLQVEVRYTAGADEYNWGRPFDPTEEEQKALAVRMQEVAKSVTKCTVSVWPKPYYKCGFVPPK